MKTRFLGSTGAIIRMTVDSLNPEKLLQIQKSLAAKRIPSSLVPCPKQGGYTLDVNVNQAVVTDILKSTIAEVQPESPPTPKL